MNILHGGDKPNLRKIDDFRESKILEFIETTMDKVPLHLRNNITLYRSA